MQNPYNYLKRLWRIKKIEKIKEKMQKQLVVDPEKDKVVWKGMRGDKAKEEALKELNLKYYPSIVRKSFYNDYDDSLSKIEEILDNLRMNYPEGDIRPTIVFIDNPQACPVCRSYHNREFDLDTYKYSYGGTIFNITHEFCRCSLMLSVIVYDLETGSIFTEQHIVRDFSY